MGRVDQVCDTRSNSRINKSEMYLLVPAGAAGRMWHRLSWKYDIDLRVLFKVSGLSQKIDNQAIYPLIPADADFLVLLCRQLTIWTFRFRRPSSILTPRRATDLHSRSFLYVSNCFFCPLLFSCNLNWHTKLASIHITIGGGGNISHALSRLRLCKGYKTPGQAAQNTKNSRDDLTKSAHKEVSSGSEIRNTVSDIHAPYQWDRRAGTSNSCLGSHFDFEP